jgi:hypothetical protein
MTMTATGTMELIENVAGREAERRAALEREYVALLSRAEVPRPGDAEALQRCLAALGLTAEDARQHAYARRQVADLTRSLPTERDAEAMRRDRTAAEAKALAGMKQAMRDMIEPLDLAETFNALRAMIVYTPAKTADGRQLNMNTPGEIYMPVHEADCRINSSNALADNARRIIRDLRAAHPQAFAGE